MSNNNIENTFLLKINIVKTVRCQKITKIFLFIELIGFYNFYLQWCYSLNESHALFKYLEYAFIFWLPIQNRIPSELSQNFSKRNVGL